MMFAGDGAAAGDDDDSDNGSAYTTASKLEERGPFGKTTADGKSFEPLRSGDEIMPIHDYCSSRSSFLCSQLIVAFSLVRNSTFQ